MSGWHLRRGVVVAHAVAVGLATGGRLLSRGVLSPIFTDYQAAISNKST